MFQISVEFLTLSLSAFASCCTKSLRATLTASGSMSSTGTSLPLGDMERRAGDMERSCDRLRIGDPVRGIGLPQPSVIVLYVLSKPKFSVTI